MESNKDLMRAKGVSSPLSHKGIKVLSQLIQDLMGNHNLRERLFLLQIREILLCFKRRTVGAKIKMIIRLK
ncbi:hypothetical protein [Gottfriedia acidiceleris]|uniref:Uncharacterized protein n=1 Tax=Gottfriedia acidiceleris TaxID=371036 RepID=A0ABY4JHP3_9BACI|nr:hypothetical protein [Gottfriedia acidiceleris]UPM53352.1 hypothetical protein MY490_16290 [Gottfriedia acidiceleris]